MEGAAVMARTSEGIGFFDLPREIRDEIYRMSFSKSYTLPTNGGGLGSGDVGMLMTTPNSGGPSESHILQISQRVRFEAEEILFNDSTFCLHISDLVQQHLSRELADRFMNLCIYIPLIMFRRNRYDYGHEVLNLFGGSRVGGKTCTIKFYASDGVPDACWVSDLKTFTGFETVRVQISGPMPFSQEERCPMQDYLRENLECALGDAMAFEDSNTRGLEFHPQW